MKDIKALPNKELVEDRMKIRLNEIAQQEGNDKTDVVVNALSCPFVTLRESTKRHNTWFSLDPKNDHIYQLTPDGFKLVWGYARNYMLNGGFLW